jgi:RNA polymerase sigma factor (TIGR02999 family)
LRLIAISSREASAKPQAAFENRRHFFAAAAEAMRRILVETARRKARLKHGGGRQRCELREDDRVSQLPDDRLLALDEALSQLAAAHPELAELVKLRYFAQMTVEQTAELLGTSPRTVKRNGVYACAWLRRAMERDGGSQQEVPSASCGRWMASTRPSAFCKRS